MIKKFFLFMLKIYQKTLSVDHGFLKHFFPYLGCRFRPTCSEYMMEKIKKKGLIKGFFLGLKRILRCNPFNLGGWDPF